MNTYFLISLFSSEITLLLPVFFLIYLIFQILNNKKKINILEKEIQYIKGKLDSNNKENDRG